VNNVEQKKVDKDCARSLG